MAVYTWTTGNGAMMPQGMASMLSTSAIETIDGWVGQIRHESVIVWESSKPRKTADKATKAASKHLAQQLTWLLA